MEWVLTEQQTLLRDSAVKLAAASGGPKRARQLRDAHLEIDAEAWRQVIAAGWLGTTVAEARGGLGLGALDLALAIEEAGRHMLMVPLAEAATAAWACSRTDNGESPHVLGAILAGTRLVVPALFASAWGYSGGPSSGMRLDADGLAIVGRVEAVPYIGSSHAFLIEVMGDGGHPLLCRVERRLLSGAPRRHVDGSTAGRIEAVGDRIAPGDVLSRGEPAARVIAGMQELLVLWTSAELMGTASAALDMTSEYLKLRKQFGKPIGSFQALQHRMVDCFVDLELSRSLLYRVLAAWDEGSAHQAMVSACKARISRGALATVRTAVQLHGAMGYTDEHDIGLYYKRAVALAAKYGNEICHVDSFSGLTTPT